MAHTSISVSTSPPRRFVPACVHSRTGATYNAFSLCSALYDADALALTTRMGADLDAPETLPMGGAAGHDCNVANVTWERTFVARPGRLV